MFWSRPISYRSSKFYRRCDRDRLPLWAPSQPLALMAKSAMPVRASRCNWMSFASSDCVGYIASLHDTTSPFLCTYSSSMLLLQQLPWNRTSASAAASTLQLESKSPLTSSSSSPSRRYCRRRQLRRQFIVYGFSKKHQWQGHRHRVARLDTSIPLFRDWLIKLRFYVPPGHKIGHYGDVLFSQSLG